MKKKILSLLVLLTLLISATLFTTSVAYADDVNAYTVKFMLDETTEYQSAEVEENKFITIPETPEKDKNVFNYWKLEDGTKFSFKKRITADYYADIANEDGEICLYAEWEQVVFTVTFKVEGEVVSVQEVQKGTSAVEPSTVVCEGKEFVRWDKNTMVVEEDMVVEAVLAPIYYTVSVYADEEFVGSAKIKHGEDATFINGLTIPEKEHYTFNGFIGETECIVKNGVIYVDYTPAEYTVTYMADDATFGAPMSALYGESTPMPSTFPEKAGHVFAGWYLDDALYNFNTTLTGNITLTARFIPIEKPKYSVTFYDYNGNQYGGTQLISEGSSAIEPGHPLRPGYDFIGWSEDFDSVSGEMHVYPTYKLNYYTVNVYDYQGKIATYEVQYGGSVTVDSALIRTQAGYEFIGFDTSLKNITGDTDINAKYRALTFAVKFYNDNNQPACGTQVVKYGESAKAPKVSKAGYKFIGFKNMDTGAMNDYDVITDNTNYIAVYEVITFTVNFIEDGVNKYTVSVEHGKYAPMYTYEKEGYVFGGWFTDEALTTQFNFITGIESDVVLYAKWTEIKKPVYTATFIVDGEVYNLQYVEQYERVLTPSIPVKEGYTFVWWEVEEYGYIWRANETIRETIYDSNLTFIAVFEEITYQVKFIYGKGISVNSGPLSTIVYVKYGEDATAPTNVNKDGYTFVKWDKDFTNVKSNMTVTALYTVNEYKVEFVDSDGNVIATQMVEYGSSPQLIANPKKEGYTFSGWKNTTDYNRDFTFDYEVKYDVVIRANFSINSYKLTYYINGEKYKEETLIYGQVINPIKGPSYNDDYARWDGWGEIPSHMPAHNVSVHGTKYEYKYYTLTLCIDGNVYREYSIREGRNTPTIYNPTNLDETIVFIGWGEIPSTLTEDVRIDAQIQKLGYYKIYYYLEGEIFKVETVLEGKSIYNTNQYKDEIEATFDETKIFNGWKFTENKMPAHDIDVHANIEYKAYYKLNYYLNGTIYKSFSILNGTKLEGTEYQLGTPTLPEYHIFTGWREKLPYNMPKEDVNIYGNSRELLEHNVTFKIDGEVYKVIKVREYSAIPLPEYPEFDGTKWVIGWKSVPSTMPSYDIEIGAELIYLNDIELVHREGTENGVAVHYLDVKITGVVNFVAIKFKIDTKYPSEAILNDEFASYNPDNHMLVYASGEVITEDTIIATFASGTRLNWNSLSSFEIYTINDDGEIVKTVCYFNGNKH